MTGAAGSLACLLRGKAKAIQTDTTEQIFFVCLSFYWKTPGNDQFDHFTGKHCSPQTGFLLQRSSSSPDNGHPFLGCWTGLICRKAKVELALGGSNNETFWALQSTGLGVIKEEKSRYCKAQVSKGKV